MSDIFYLTGILIIILNIINIINHKILFESIEWILKSRKIGKDPYSDEFSDRINYKIITIWSTGVIITSAWILIGLLTDDWLIFLLILLSNIIINKILLSKLNSSIRKKVSLLKSLIIVSTITYLIVNHCWNML